MKKYLSVIIIFILCSFFTIPTMGDEAPAWKVELDETIQNYHFLQDGKYLFFTNAEYLWLYDTQTGKEVYNMEIDDFEEEGIHQLIEEWYLVSTGDGVQCFDAAKGEKIWESEFDVSQSDFTEIMAFGDIAVLRYGEDHVAFNFADGKQIWQTEIDYYGELVDIGTHNYFEFNAMKKIAVMVDGGDFAIYDMNDGKLTKVIEDIEPNGNLIEKKFPWSMRGRDNECLVLVTDDGAVLIDVKNNKELARKEIDIDGDYSVMLPTPNGCAILGEENVVYFNYKDGSVKELPFPVDDMRTFKSYTVGDKGILVMSMEDQVFGIDLEAGEILWNTPKDDETFEGYIHKYIKQDGNNIIVAYNRARLSSHPAGTYIFCMSFDALTGKLNYRTTVLASQAALSDFTRGLAKTITGAFATFVAVGSGGVGAGAAGNAIDMVSDMMGYGNIGFQYNYFEHNGNIVFESRSEIVMFNPETREEPGEGYVAVNSSTGEIVYKDYFAIAEGMTKQNMDASCPPLVVGNISYVGGEERLYAFDLNSGKRLWSIDGNEKLAMTTDLMVADDILYLQFGKIEYNIGLKEDEIVVKEKLDVDPYGFMALDAKTGDVLWTVDMETHPGLYSPQFTLDNYYNGVAKHLYYSDEKGTYALKMGGDGGSLEWSFLYDANKIGEMEYDETYAINEKWIGTQKVVTTTTYSTGFSTTTTSGGLDEEETESFIEDAAGADFINYYVSWGNIWGVTAKRCLRVTTNGQVIIIFGPSGIASVNPQNGKANWITEWDYDHEEMQYVPKIFRNNIAYCLDRELTLLDMNTGEEIWKVEEAKKPRFFTSPDNTQLFSIDDEVISGYNL
jgi:putative pyrroloquinoline-quinone binding quinoprotein